MRAIDLVLVLDPDTPSPRAAALADQLRSWLDGQAEVQGDSWPLRVVHPEGQVLLRPEPVPQLADIQLARTLLDDEEKKRLERCTDALVLEIGGADDEVLMRTVQRGLSLVRPALRGLLAVFDPTAASALPGHWAASVADAPVPPRPESMFAIHAVLDGVSDTVWMHTHGLQRAGIPEIELLEVPREHASQLGHVVNAVAARLLTDGMPEDGEVVWWGSGVEMALVPWDEVQHLASHQGGPDDRDDVHPTDNRVLCIPVASGGWASAATLAPLGDHPVLFKSNWESARMEALARFHWELFARLHGVLGELEDFRFLVKMGFEGESGHREHLWFHVHETSREALVAELLNEPHQDLGMHAGDVRQHSPDRLSDLQVYTPMGKVDAETLPQLAVWLQHQLDRQGD